MVISKARRLAWAVALAVLSGLGLPGAAWADRHALLIGISDYGNKKNNLEGPVNDVVAMRDVLIRRWGIPEAQVQVLTNAQATRANILRALSGLKERTAQGDEIVIYFSGHGTSSLDRLNIAPLPDGTGAFIPYGFDASSPAAAEAGLVIGRRDLQPIYQALDAGGRRLWVIADTCFSGNLARSVGLGAQASELPGRYLPIAREHVIIAQADYLRDRMASYRPPPPYPYVRTAFLGAAPEGEIARDIPSSLLARFPTMTGKPHGALTDALLRVLDGRVPADVNQDGQLSLSEVHRAVADFMATRAYGHAPQRRPSVREDQHGIGERAVLSVRQSVQPVVASAPLRPLRVFWQGEANRLAPAASGVQGLVPAESAAEAGIIVRAARGRQAVELLITEEVIASIPNDDTPRLRGKLLQLAWAHRIRQLAEARRRAVLDFEISPGEFGSTFAFGERIHFSTRVVKASWLLILNADSEGRVSVLYPALRSELEPLPPGHAHAIPGINPQQQIVVRAPEGIDMQMAFAFEARPEGLEKFMGAVNLEPGDPLLARLESLITESPGGFVYAPGWLRAVSPGPSRKN